MGYFDSIYASDLPSRAVNVYRYLCERANKKRLCFPSIKTIAKDLHISTSTVKRALNELDEAGFIQREHRWRDNGGNTSDIYIL